jgi:hypothetical protein
MMMSIGFLEASPDDNLQSGFGEEAGDAFQGSASDRTAPQT